MNLAVPLESVQTRLPEAPILLLVPKGTPEVVTVPSGEGSESISAFSASAPAPGPGRWGGIPLLLRGITPLPGSTRGARGEARPQQPGCGPQVKVSKDHHVKNGLD